MLNDADDMVYTRLSPLIWRESIERRAKLNGNNINGSATVVTKCRNSIQGKSLMVDDEGYVCPRARLTRNGCCAIDSNEPSLLQYDCQSCDTDVGCCAIYEYCVSCCLNPDKVSRIAVHIICSCKFFLMNCSFRFVFRNSISRRCWRNQVVASWPFSRE